MKIDAVAGDNASLSIYAEVEGAYVHLALESSGREDALMTPDQAEKLSFAIAQLAQDARKYGAESE